MSATATLLTTFNDHFADFVGDIQSVFPDDVDILAAKNALTAIRKANPKMIVKIWKTYISSKYPREIEAGDITFFLTKDYSGDIAASANSDKIMESIDRLRGPIRNMSEENQLKSMQYISNLTKLSNMIDG